MHDDDERPAGRAPRPQTALPHPQGSPAARAAASARRSEARLWRLASAEATGSAVLLGVLVSQSLVLRRMGVPPGAFSLLCGAASVAAVLVALLIALQPVSAAHNPAITLAEWHLGLLRAHEALVIVAAQVSGAVTGVVLANVSHGETPFALSDQERLGGGAALSEGLVTAGLLLVVFASLRAGRAENLAFAVGAYVFAVAMSTTSSFANPAVTLARTVTDAPAGISPTSVGPYVGAQLVGGVIGYALARVLYPSVAVAQASSDSSPDARASRPDEAL